MLQQEKTMGWQLRLETIIVSENHHCVSGYQIALDWYVRFVRVRTTTFDEWRAHTLTLTLTNTNPVISSELSPKYKHPNQGLARSSWLLNTKGTVGCQPQASLSAQFHVTFTQIRNQVTVPDKFRGDKTLLTSHETISFYVLTMLTKLMIFTGLGLPHLIPYKYVASHKKCTWLRNLKPHLAVSSHKNICWQEI